MSHRRPPRVATWLLQRLLYGRHADAVIGDLAQLYAEGRTPAWYWNQVLRALLAGGVEGMRDNGRSLVLALAAGWGAIFLWRELNALFIDVTGDIYRATRAHIHDRGEALTAVWAIGALLRFTMFAASGWLTARLHARQPILAVVVLAATVAIWPVPWQQIRLEWGPLWLAHYGTALAGIFLGGFLSAYSLSTRTPITYPSP